MIVSSCTLSICISTLSISKNYPHSLSISIPYGLSKGKIDGVDGGYVDNIDDIISSIAYSNELLCRYGCTSYPIVKEGNRIDTPVGDERDEQESAQERPSSTISLNQGGRHRDMFRYKSIRPFRVIGPLWIKPGSTNEQRSCAVQMTVGVRNEIGKAVPMG